MIAPPWGPGHKGSLTSRDEDMLDKHGALCDMSALHRNV